MLMLGQPPSLGVAVASDTAYFAGNIRVETGKTPVSAKRLTKILAKEYGWAHGMEWRALCLIFWNESRWNYRARNPRAVNGKHAFGIPQILGLKTLDPKRQISKGLEYIKMRYGKPSIAWQHHKKHHWY